MIRLHRPRSIRSRLLLATVASVGVALIVLLVAFNVLFERRLSANATDQARARAAAELSVIDASGGAIDVREALDGATGDSPIWVFDGSRVLEEPRISTLDSAATRISSGNETAVDAGEYRLVALPVTHSDRRIGTVVAAVSLAPYEEAQHTAVIASIALSVIVLMVVAFVTRWILVAVLRPVSSMTVSARDWSEHDLDRRFQLGAAHDELTELAATLDQLLDRNATALRREQRLTAEISHELRTPLARITTQSELALRRERPAEEYRDALREIASRSAQMQRILETLMAAARAESIGERGTAEAEEVGAQAIEACAGVAGHRRGSAAGRPRSIPEGRHRRRYRRAHSGPADRERLQVRTKPGRCQRQSERRFGGLHGPGRRTGNPPRGEGPDLRPRLSGGGGRGRPSRGGSRTRVVPAPRSGGGG